MSTSDSRSAELWLGSGARQVENAVLDELLLRLAEARREPTLIARPLRVVVPSRSLREHLGARLIERAGAGIAGLTIQTLYGLALEVVEHAGPAPRVVASSMPILVREAARKEPVLRSQLDSLVDGYGVVRAAVDDLLDSGFEQPHAEAVIERLEALADTSWTVEIACAVVRVAARVSNDFVVHGLNHRSSILRRAEELLDVDPEVLPARGILVHGFADATGCATELLATLLRRPGSVAVLDRPPEPERGGQVEGFVSRFRERLAASGCTEKILDAEKERVSVHGIEAPGGSSELREVARRIQVLLVSGVPAESMAVVARDLGPYVLALRAHFRALAIPFSGLGQTLAADPGSVRGVALVDLLRSGSACLTERWLDAGVFSDETEVGDLRLAFRGAGVVRVADVARLSLPASGLRSPGPLGFETGADELAMGRIRRRQISSEVLGEVRDQADLCVDVLTNWPRRQNAEAHLGCLSRLLEEGLGWDRESPETVILMDVMRSHPSDLLVEREDVVQLVEEIVRAHSEMPIGGRGGGVQVLGVMEARARTFAHLFVVGLNRDVFPRPVREDSILGDSIRGVLAELLPDIPLKARGYDEERHLFAQLLSSAPEVTLSWQSLGDDGKARAPSTFVDRLRWGRDDFVPTGSESVLVSPALRQGPVPGTRSVFEVALEASLEPGWSALAGVLPAALEERARLLPARGTGCDGVAEASGRLAVASELDSAFGEVDLGPYFGSVGRLVREEDPRRAGISVTALESLAYCPWQFFLGSVLRVEPVIDRAEEIPELGGAVLGTLVHGVLEGVYREASVPAYASLEALDEGEALSVPWPSPEVVDRLLRSEARKALVVNGLGFSGLEPVAVARARPLVDRARELGWPGPKEALAAEVKGEVTVQGISGESEVISFRADRVDRKDGRWIFSDYKTGARISTAKKVETRERHWLEKVQTGRNLQAVAYARARGNSEDIGRYLFLDPDVPPGQLEYAVGAGSDEFQTAFEAAARKLFVLRTRGAYVPRLIAPGGGVEGEGCRSCRVAEACLRGESGARGRLGRWLDQKGEPGTDPLRASLQALWDPKDVGGWAAEGRVGKGDERR